MKAKIGVLFAMLLALCILLCSGAAADDPLSGTAWLGPDDTLYVFRSGGAVTVVHRNEDSDIDTRVLAWQLDGSNVSLGETSDGEGSVVLRGELSAEGLAVEGEPMTRVEIPEVEPDEAPGIAGWWSDGASQIFLRFRPNGRADIFDLHAGEQMLDFAGYLRYGPYVAFTGVSPETVWLFYDATAEELGVVGEMLRRISPDEAAAHGLDIGSIEAPEPEPAPPEPVVSQGNTEYLGPRADSLQDTAWLGSDDTLYVFGHYGEANVIGKEEGGTIWTKPMSYLMDGGQVLLQEQGDTTGKTYLRGELADGALIFGGVRLERMAPAEGGEPTESPGVAGGWLGMDGSGTLLLHPDGRATAFDADGSEMRMPEGLRYAHYGPYTVIQNGEESAGILYNEAADELDAGTVTFRRMPLAEALALGLGQKPDTRPSVDLSGVWVGEAGEWLRIADGKLSFASRSFHPEMPYTVEGNGTVVAYIETNRPAERMELGSYGKEDGQEMLRLDRDYRRATLDSPLRGWNTPGWVAKMAGVQTEPREEWPARAQRIAAGALESAPLPANIRGVTVSLDEGAMERCFGSDADKAICESISPDGGCLLAVVNGSLVLVDLPTGERREVTPDYERSVGNAEVGLGNFEHLMRDLVKSSYFGAEEVAWSSDGRYAVFANRQMTVAQLKFVTDLFVVDTLRAQAFAAASFATNQMGSNAVGAVTGAWFGEDGMLYYLLYSPMVRPMALMRHDLETGESELVYHYPSDALSLQSPDGRLVSIGRPSQGMRSSALHSYSTRDGVPEDQTLLFPPMLLTRQLALSRKSGMGLVQLQPIGVFGYGMFSVLDAHDGFAGYNRIALVTADGTAVERLDAAQWLDSVVSNWESGLQTLRESFRFCANAQLTDDGEHALLLHGTIDQYSLSLLRLRDLALFPVDTELSQEQLADCAFDEKDSKYPAGYRCLPGGWMIVNGRLARLVIE